MTRHPLFLPVLVLSLLAARGDLGLADDRGWVSLFDGQSLDGWKVQGGTARYKVEDGAIVGTTVEGSPNTFLCRGDFKDFALELEIKCDPRLNSGVQVRSHAYAKDDPDPKNRQRAGVVYGPQCEVARKETGTAGRFYDEGRRGRWLAEIAPAARDAFKDDGWNHYRIVVQGPRYRSWINGVAASDFTDDTDKSGLIGLQVHGIARGEGPYQVRFRNIRIKELGPDEAIGADGARGDAEALQGTWAMVSLNAGGEGRTGKQVAAARLVVEGDRFIPTVDGTTVPCTFTVDPATTPKSIDLTYTSGTLTGKTVRGIYRLDGDTFVICRRLRPVDPRPSEFSAAVGSKCLLVAWTRSRPAGEAKPEK